MDYIGVARHLTEALDDYDGEVTDGALIDIRQEIRKVGFWKNQHARELLTKALVRDLDRSGLCPAGKERDIAQRLVALAKENHENLTHS